MSISVCISLDILLYHQDTSSPCLLSGSMDTLNDLTQVHAVAVWALHFLGHTDGVTHAT